MHALRLCVCVLLLAACGSEAQRALQQIEQQGSFSARRFDTPGFVLFGLLRPAKSMHAEAVGNTLHVYIEGDGHAWTSRSQPSADPTPKEAVALHLAANDPSPGPVLYLARPCQYVSSVDARMCTQKYWTAARFAPEVIESLNAAVDMAKAESRAQKVALVGYSGGGGAAALMAAQREDVVFLGSVAGTLNHAAWTARHKVSPLHGSLNPLDAAAKLTHIPQRHLSSHEDAIMPPEISETFCTALAQPQACITVPGMTHSGAWERVWQYTY